MIAGRFTRDREIGRGGMGAVWLGRDEVLDRPVAIKRLGALPGETSPDQERAAREAKIAASLNHPHIVGVFDLLAEDGQQWMVMEYVEGQTLSELVRAGGPLSHAEAGRIISQAASALAAAHANGVVHRDVKPSNILVRADGHVKLTDFGIARGSADAALTQTGLVTGSPAYLAPEVASGQQASPASDVWSLGATLFHALAGHPPYDASDNVLGALYRIVNEAPPRIEDAGVLAPLLEATMTRTPAQRWSMQDIVHFLDSPDDELSSRTPVPSTDAPTEAMHVIPGLVGDAAPEVPAAPDPEPAAASGSRRAAPERRSWLPAVISALVAALVIAIVVLALQDDPQENLATDPAAPSAEAPSSEPTASPTPTPTPEASSEPTRRELRSFVSDYLTLASSDPAQGIEQLTPAFREQSTPGYEDFWGSVSNTRLLRFSADTAALTVSYTYRYQRRGFGRVEEPVSLQLVATDDGFLIAGPA